MKQVSLSGWGGISAPDGVIIQAVTGGGQNGKVELSEVSAFDVESVTVLGSLVGTEGGVKVEKSRLIPDLSLRIETGVGGKTEVKENQLGAESLIRIAAGPDESGCIAQPNSIVGTPLVLELCP
jgi:hypothetical protein